MDHRNSFHNYDVQVVLNSQFPFSGTSTYNCPYIREIEGILYARYEHKEIVPEAATKWPYCMIALFSSDLTDAM